MLFFGRNIDYLFYQKSLKHSTPSEPNLVTQTLSAPPPNSPKL